MASESNRKFVIGFIVVLVIGITIGIVVSRSTSSSPPDSSSPSNSSSYPSGAPSNEIIEEAVFQTMTEKTSVYGLTPTYEWLEKVEVIRVGRPYSLGYRTCWPIDVYLIGNGREEEVEGIIYQDAFGDWIANIA